MQRLYIYLFSAMIYLLALALGVTIGLAIGGLVSTTTLIFMILFTLLGVVAVFRDWFISLKKLEN